MSVSNPKRGIQVYACNFVAGEHGKTEGVASFCKQEGERISDFEIPKVTPMQGYEFKDGFRLHTMS